MVRSIDPEARSHIQPARLQHPRVEARLPGVMFGMQTVELAVEERLRYMAARRGRAGHLECDAALEEELAARVQLGPIDPGQGQVFARAAGFDGMAFGSQQLDQLGKVVNLEATTPDLAGLVQVRPASAHSPSACPHRGR